MTRMMDAPDIAPDAEDLGAVVAEQAARLFERRVDRDTLAAADRGEWQAELWTAVEEAGLPLALLDEDAGGVGLPPVAAFGLIRLAARHAAPVPLGETMVAAALWGAPLEGPATLAPGTAPDGHGRLARLAFGRDAAQALIHAGGSRAALVPLAGRALVHDRSLANEPRDALELSGLPADAIREVPGLGPDGLAPHGALIRAAQMSGAMDRALEMAVAYANEREQFGRPIAKFQAIQQMLAEAAGHVAAASAIVDMAAEAWGTEDFDFAAGLAKSRTGEAAGRVSAIVHQVHAAMGFTQEHGLHFLTRRLWSWREEFGAESWWEERIGRRICAAGGEALWPAIVDVTAAGARA